MGLIEWRLLEGTNFHEAFIGDWIVGSYHDFSDKVCVCGVVSPCDSIHAANAKAEELFTEWLKSAGLVQRPESCGKCFDTGEISTDEVEFETDDEICYVQKTCPCTKDPNSLYSFIKEIKGG